MSTKRSAVSYTALWLLKCPAIGVIAFKSHADNVTLYIPVEVSRRSRRLLLKNRHSVGLTEARAVSKPHTLAVIGKVS